MLEKISEEDKISNFLDLYFFESWKFYKRCQGFVKKLTEGKQQIPDPRKSSFLFLFLIF